MASETAGVIEASLVLTTYRGVCLLQFRQLANPSSVEMEQLFFPSSSPPLPRHRLL